MKNKSQSNDISIMAPLIMLIVFSVCVMFVLLFGAKLYKEALNRDQMNYETRTVNQYLTTRFRQSNGNQMMFIGDFHTATENDNGDTFYFVEQINSITYYTRIYCHEGNLYELFSESNTTFDKQDGEIILPLHNLHFSKEGSLITVTVTHSNGDTDTLTFYNRCQIGGTHEK